MLVYRTQQYRHILRGEISSLGGYIIITIAYIRIWIKCKKNEKWKAFPTICINYMCQIIYHVNFFFIPSEMAAQDDVYYDGTVATSYLHGGAGAVSSRMSLLVASEADNSDTTEQVSGTSCVYRSHTFNALVYTKNAL